IPVRSDRLRPERSADTDGGRREDRAADPPPRIVPAGKRGDRLRRRPRPLEDGDRDSEGRHRGGVPGHRVARSDADRSGRPARRLRVSSSSPVPSTRRGRPLRISRARKVELVLSGLGRRYLGEDALAGGTTALAKITAETEDPFKVLIGTILSQRTRDEMTEIASRQLFARYGTPKALARADVRDVQRRIKPVGFYRQKARKVREVSRVLLDRHGGLVP